MHEWNESQLGVVAGLLEKMVRGETLSPDEQLMIVEYAWIEQTAYMHVQGMDDLEIIEAIKPWITSDPPNWTIDVVADPDTKVVYGLVIVDNETQEPIYG